jgi:L,D-peptidoglycan transpeptidase YkuD (ErfK/YbiS/YcfS/YnhG family)
MDTLGSQNKSSNISVLCKIGEIKCVARFYNIEYKVSIGKNGLSNDRKEGDDTTPIGQFSLSKVIFYRDNKVSKPRNRNYIFRKIKDNFGWCDDMKSINYNKFIDLKRDHRCGSFENLNRVDNLYDIILPLNYNVKPVIAGKGSAIFIHIQRENRLPTAGCIAFKQDDLLAVINKLDKNTKVNINYIVSNTR